MPIDLEKTLDNPEAENRLTSNTIPFFKPLYDLIEAGRPDQALVGAKLLLDKGSRDPDLLRVLAYSSAAVDQPEITMAAVKSIVSAGSFNERDLLLLGSSLQANDQREKSA